MRKILLAVLVAAMATGCGGGASALQSPPARWATGFWFWQGSAPEIRASVTLDVLYVQVGTIRRNPPVISRAWDVASEVPVGLPPAREYWLVYRFEEPGSLPAEAAPALKDAITTDLATARRRKLPVSGVQLDIDSPTGRLPEYATVLKDIRAGLPSGVRLSITALLDWFRPNTEIAAVVKQVDEFVPQFYDTGETRQGHVVASPVDAKNWGPLFERFRKPYRIGASSFGRARFAPKPVAGAAGLHLGIADDLSPLDVALLPGVRRTESSTPAGEIRLEYEMTRSAKMGWTELSPGDGYEFVFPTPDSMRRAVEGAKAMGPHCTGILFFRWPSSRELMAAQPDQVLRLAGVLSSTPVVRLHAQERGCAAVRCTDLFLTDAEPLSREPLRYTVRSSIELEYFLPGDKSPTRMIAEDTIELAAPPFLGRTRLYLGRAVTAEASEFRLEQGSR